MHRLKLILRWHGEKDVISLREYAQIPGIYGIVTSLYHLPLGIEWEKEEILRLKRQVEDVGLKLELVDSFRIHEDIKRGLDTRRALLDVYRKNIRMLAECGVRVICYNFMPVFDWTRTDLAYPLPDGSDCLALEGERIRQIDPREGIRLPGWGTNYAPETLRALLDAYRHIDERALWDHCRYFLDACLPVARECGVKLALHPDDPPWPVFGLPRIAKNAEDYRRILHYCDCPENAVTFCCGSFGSSAENDMPAMIREFGRERIPFVHFRNIMRFGTDGSFYECGHLTESGSSDMGEVMKALYDVGFDGYIRPDHGRRIWNEAWSVHTVRQSDGSVREVHYPDGFGGQQPAAGYGLFDRALGAMYIQGLWEGLSKSVPQPKETE